jgi:hypothetical protein
LGDLEDSCEGLIFTDEILGRIADLSTSDQKAGRAAGLIADSQQYTGLTHYWTDSETAEAILRHNRKIDSINEGPSEPMRMIDLVTTPKCQPVRNHDIHEDTYLVYDDLSKARKAAKMLGRNMPAKWKSTDERGFIKTAIGGPSEVIDVYTAIKRTAHQSCDEKKGNNRLCFPCYKNTNDITSIHYVLRVGDAPNVDEICAKYPHLRVPQFGGF